MTCEGNYKNYKIDQQNYRTIIENYNMGEKITMQINEFRKGNM